MLDKFRISLARVAKIMDSWLKTPTLHAVTAEVAELNNRKSSKRRRVFPARGQSRNKNSQKRKRLNKKITGSNTS